MFSFFHYSQQPLSSRPWDLPEVNNIIQQNICYLPIAHSDIKALNISDIEEDLVDLNTIQNARIIPLLSFNDKYTSGHDDYGQVRIGLYECLLKMLQFLPDNIGIAFFEGLRPLYKQKEYFDRKFLEVLQSVSEPTAAYQETCKHISPFIDNVPVHCTGAAIDFTLFLRNKEENVLLDMGMFGTIFGPNPHQETFSAQTTPAQRDNRLLLLNAALTAGLVNYGYEWWHFSFQDKAWAFVKRQPHALYGLAVKKDHLLTMTKDEYIKKMAEQNASETNAAVFV